MNKLNKFILSVLVLLVAGTIVYAAMVKTSADTTNEVVVEKYEYTNVHEITTSDTYKINGTVVTKNEFDAFKNELDKYSNNSTTALTLTSEDLDTDGIARFSQFLDFEFKGNTVVAVKVKSNNVVSVDYKYSDAYESYLSADGKTYIETGGGSIYQNINSSINGLEFTVGKPLATNYTVVYHKDVAVNYYLFKLTDNSMYAPLTFDQVFSSITINIK